MMTKEQKIIRAKVGLLELAKQLVDGVQRNVGWSDGGLCLFHLLPHRP